MVVFLLTFKTGVAGIYGHGGFYCWSIEMKNFDERIWLNILISTTVFYFCMNYCMML